MKKKLCVILSVLLSVSMLFTACGGSNADIDFGIDFGFDFFSESSETEGTAEDVEEVMADAEAVVEFQDPLVERCVRMELGKVDGEPVTAGECALLEKLTIDCDLEYSYVNCWTNLSGIAVANYVDLCDLRYMTGLKELEIDNDVLRDTLVNMDAIGSCSKLEQLTMQYNPMSTFYYGTLPMGYKYLAGIVEKLPSLTYINLGYPVPAEHQEIVCQGRKDLVFEADFAEGTFVEDISSPDEWELVATQDIEKYIASWTEGYDDRELYSLKVNNQATFDELLEELPVELEDLHIQIAGADALDMKGVERFKNLKTFSLLNEISYSDFQDNHSKMAVDIKGLEALGGCEELYSVSFVGVEGDFTPLADLVRLKELSLHRCVFDSPKFIGEIPKLRELVVVYNSCEDLQGYLLENGASFEELRYLRTENGEASDYAGIEKYPNLEMLSIGSMCGVTDVKYIAKCPRLKYLFFETPNEELDISALKERKSLKFLFINSWSDLENLTGVEEVVKANVVSVILPFTHSGYRVEDNYDDINSWIDAAVSNPNISCFIPGKTIYVDFNEQDIYPVINFEKLHENDIMCRFAELWLYSRPEEYQTMEQILEDLKEQ